MTDLLLRVAICLAFAGVALRFRVLDLGGTVVAVIIGGVIIFAKGPGWFVPLLLFFLLGAAVSRYKHTFKRLRLHERPSRRAMNVVANGAVPALLALFAVEYDFAVPYVASIALALADTFASELGVLSNNAYLITTLKPTAAGTNGAVSPFGQATALLGATVVAFTGWAAVGLSAAEAALCMVLGFIGCQIDSVLGATFQGRYKGTITGHDTILTNSDVNLISVSVIALVALLIVEIF
jgi:uncharacterized protein (TIGR00297 family)